jgi:hypothetical protein
MAIYDEISLWRHAGVPIFGGYDTVFSDVHAESEISMGTFIANGSKGDGSVKPLMQAGEKPIGMAITFMKIGAEWGIYKAGEQLSYITLGEKICHYPIVNVTAGDKVYINVTIPGKISWLTNVATGNVEVPGARWERNGLANQFNMISFNINS